MSKLTAQQIANELRNGAILRRVYGVYSYWVLDLPSGAKIYSLRKGAPEAAKSQIEYIIVEQEKLGFSLKAKI
jgi:hypothetical protein